MEEVLIRLMGLATAIYLARVLTPSAYGGLGVALAIASVLTTLVQAGTASRAIRLTALNPDSIPESYSQIVGLRMVSASIVITALILSAPVISEVFSVPATLLILSAFLLIRPAITVMWAFNGLDKMYITAIAGIVEKTMIFIGLLLLVRGREHDVLWIIVLEVFAALMMTWWLYKRLRQIYPEALGLLANLLRYYLVIMLPLVLLLGLYADEILALLFGSVYASAGTTLIFLLAALPFLAVSHSLRLLLRAIPRPRAVLASRVVGTVTLVVLAAAMIPRYGATGAAVAVVASEVSGMTLLFWLVYRSIGAVPWNRRCFVPLLACGLALLAFMFTVAWPVLFRLSIAAIVYAMVVGLLKAITFDEIRSLPHVLLTAFSKTRTDNIHDQE
jgi:O-antigen/teichoic acid export membrane protein